MTSPRTDRFSDADDAGLIEDVLTGSDPAAEALVRRHGGWMLSVAQRYMQDRSLAEDCVQEAFANAFHNLAKFEQRSSLKTWLNRILINQALMKLRTQRARNENEMDELLPEFDTESCRIEQPWRQIKTPEQIVGSAYLRSSVLEKINELPEKYRHVLMLRDIEEMTTSEVATALELTESNVKVRLHRARSALKKLLEPILRGDMT